MGNHIFFNNRRFEELLANMGQDAVGYSCNPFGVCNNPESMMPYSYTPQNISLSRLLMIIISFCLRYRVYTLQLN